MKIVKYTEGHMRQVFDTELGKFVRQEFVVGDSPYWEEENGECIELISGPNFWSEKQFGPNGPYLPYTNENFKYPQSGPY